MTLVLYRRILIAIYSRSYHFYFTLSNYTLKTNKHSHRLKKSFYCLYHENTFESWQNDYSSCMHLQCKNSCMGVYVFVKKYYNPHCLLAGSLQKFYTLLFLKIKISFFSDILKGFFAESSPLFSENFKELLIFFHFNIEKHKRP